jgi:pimeloyl-ACP methyl ester carboxylesterase
MRQEIRFCQTSDGVRIAYATLGQGPQLVKAAHWLSHVEFDIRSRIWRPLLEGLARYHRLIRYDERGCGLSDWDVTEFSVDAWVRDLEAVVDAAELDRFALIGLSQGGPVAITYAVRHPERVTQLVLYGAYVQGWAKRGSAELREERMAMMTLTRHGWGQDVAAYRQIFTGMFAPDATEEQARSFNELQRVSTSPENAVRFQEAFGQIDVSDLVPRLRVPTLVIHARNDLRCSFDEGRRLAAAIPGSRFVALDTRNHILLEQDPAFSVFLSEVHAFLGADASAMPEIGPVSAEAEASETVRELVTVMFTDIVASTPRAAELGDRGWTELLQAHNALVRRRLREYGGKEVDTTGDGFVAVFDAPARAIRCAHVLTLDVKRLGIEIRAGVHTGECERIGRSYSGIAMHVGARVMAAAQPSEVLVTDTVAQLVAGSGIGLTDRGAYALRGIPGDRQLFRVESR